MLLQKQRVPPRVATDVEHAAMRVLLEHFFLLRVPKSRLGEIRPRAARDVEAAVRALDDLERVLTVGMVPHGMTERVLLVR